MSDMYFDTDSFDFNMISDVVGLHDNNGYPINTATDKQSISRNAAAQRERTPDDFFNDDVSDLMGDVLSEPEAPEQDFNQDSSDLERPVDSADALRITEYVNAAPDDAVFTIGNREISKADMNKLIQRAEKVDRDADYFKNAAEEHDSISEGILKRGFMGKIAIEQNILRLQNRLNQNLTDAEWRATQQDLQLANAALQNLHNDVNQAWNQRQQQEQITNYNRMYIADQALSDEIPNWEKYQPHVLGYMRDQGIPNNVIEKIYDKGVAKAMFKAYMYDKNKQQLAEKLKSNSPAVNARSTSSAVKSNRNQKLSEVDAAKAKQAIAKIGGNRQDNINAFAYLKD